MHDRLVFDTTHLDNGVTVYGKTWDVPFVELDLYVPVGHIHNTGPIRPGTAHFLEHLVCCRSERFPEPYSFDTFVAHQGGSFDAVTSLSRTTYQLRVPQQKFRAVFTAFMEHLASPLIADAFIQQEVGIIRSERLRKSKWYPGHSRLGQYARLGWKHNAPVTLQQSLGDDTDLQHMSEESLRAVHAAYFDPRMHVFVGGAYDHDHICEVMGHLRTRHHTLAERYEPLQWRRREYHEVDYAESGRYEYRIGGILKRHDSLTFVGNYLLGTLLTNSTCGALYEWLRRERSWTYDLTFRIYRSSPPVSCEWDMILPLEHREQVEHVRAHLHEKITAAISDRTRIAQRLDLLLLSEVFWYQTVRDVLNEGASMVHTFGQIFSEEESRDLLQQSGGPEALRRMYDEHWSPRVIGEFLATPESR